MIKALRPCLLAVVLVPAVILLGAALLGRIAGSEPGFGSLPQLMREMRCESRRAEELACRHEVVIANLVARRRLIADLIAGRVPFAAAVARFRELDAIHPAGCRAAYPGQTEAERLGHAMVDYACEELAGYPPDRAARVRARLEADLAGFLEVNGSLAPTRLAEFAP
jgi:hypothetical protein